MSSDELIYHHVKAYRGVGVSSATISYGCMELKSKNLSLFWEMNATKRCHVQHFTVYKSLHTFVKQTVIILCKNESPGWRRGSAEENDSE